jgi:hypothetical protein
LERTNQKLFRMVYEYFEATHDYEFIRKALPILEKVKSDQKFSISLIKSGVGLLEQRTPN